MVDSLSVKESGELCLQSLVFGCYRSEIVRRCLHKLTTVGPSFLNLGCQLPLLSTEDLSSDTRLPINDISWDQGVRTKNCDPVSRSSL